MRVGVVQQERGRVSFRASRRFEHDFFPREAPGCTAFLDATPKRYHAYLAEVQPDPL